MATFSRETTGIEVVNLFKDEVEGRTILITGASDTGLGAETAVSLAHANPAHLVLLARTEGKVTPVMSKIKALNSAIKTTFVPIELDDFHSVRTAAAKVNEAITKLDIAINNAGIMAVPKFTTNKDGIELQFATNHLGHFLFTALIFPKILAAGKNARIINLSSDGYKIGPCRLDDYNFDRDSYDGWSGYGQSKTANILFTRQLATKLAPKGILSFTVHPGVIFGTSLGTPIKDEADPFASVNDIAVRNTGLTFEMNEPKSIQQGVATTLITALDPRIANLTGTYWADGQKEELRDYAASLENAQKLWTLSEKLVGEKFEL